MFLQTILYPVRKYTRRRQGGPKRLWIGPRIIWPILSALMFFWLIWTNQRHRKINSFWSCLVQFHQRPTNVEKNGSADTGTYSETFSSVLFYFLQVIFGVTYVGLVHYSLLHYLEIILTKYWNMSVKYSDSYKSLHRKVTPNHTKTKKIPLIIK